MLCKCATFISLPIYEEKTRIGKKGEKVWTNLTNCAYYFKMYFNSYNFPHDVSWIWYVSSLETVGFPCVKHETHWPNRNVPAGNQVKRGQDRIKMVVLSIFPVCFYLFLALFLAPSQEKDEDWDKSSPKDPKFPETPHNGRSQGCFIISPPFILLHIFFLHVLFSNFFYFGTGMIILLWLLIWSLNWLMACLFDYLIDYW